MRRGCPAVSTTITVWKRSVLRSAVVLDRPACTIRPVLRHLPTIICPRSTNMEVASNDALRGGDAAAVAGEPQRRVVVEHRHSDGIGEDARIPVIVQRGPQ